MPKRHTNDSKVDAKDLSTLKDYIATVTILEYIPDAIFILNTTGRIEYANNSALKLLQIEQDKLIGKLIDDILMDNIRSDHSLPEHNDQSVIRNQNLIDHLKCGIFGDIEATLVNKKHIVPVFLNFNAIPDKNNSIKFIIVTAKDISHWKKLERELKLQQALSVSNNRLKALGELSVGLVHELSQPLGTLKLKMDMTQALLQSSNFSKEVLEHGFSEIMQLTNKMAGIVENIRLFAKRTEDHTFSMVDINKAIDSACWLTSYEMDKRNIKLTLKKGKYIPYIVESAISIEQVFVNLLTNAREALDEFVLSGKRAKKWTKEIIITTKFAGNKWVEISIEDNAGGIDKKVIERIFEPFFTTKESGLNTGVGLTIAKSIIAAMGGNINVKVYKGKGSRFTIRIPVVQKDEREQLLT
ncbi:MAG: ATP-binding protein [Candidatus Hatepunaea meridiana]|nr:ATP-binding protein [Candidatus Hatepunaea meridiana]